MFPTTNMEYLEIVKLIIMYSTASISIHVLDILQAADKFKASLLELGKIFLVFDQSLGWD